MAEKKNLYMLQVNFPYGKTAHLPYTAAALCAYAFSDGLIADNYELKKIFYLRDHPEKILDALTDPAVIGFSSYIWNFEFNKYIAAEVKKRYPGCVIIFGGHHVPPGDSLLRECPYIDFLIHGEGEEPFLCLLKSQIDKRDPAEINGISFRTKTGFVTNPSFLPGDEYIDYPSPYTGGYFDDILSSDKDLAFMALIETTRGCPNACSYCDWSNMKSKIRKFPLQRVYDDIRWISEHHILGLGAADSNFGIFERDSDIADYIIRMYLKNGFPKGYQTSYAKNSNERIFEIGCALEKYRLSKGITLSFQSMSPQVLENIGRKNITVENYSRLMDMYNKAGIATYTELILGLPGETKQSFSEGIDSLLNLGQHNSIYIHNCEWLPCSIMGTPDYTSRYGIKTSRILLNQPHIETDIFDGIPEYSNIVTSTCSMSKTDWIDMNLFSFTVQCFHHMGIFQLFALYLHNEKKVGYSDFYHKVLSWLRCSDNPASAALKEIENRLSGIADEKPNASFVIIDERFGKVRWPFEEYLFLCTVWDMEGFYSSAMDFLKGFHIDEDIFNDLFLFAKTVVKRPFYRGGDYEFSYNFENYFTAALENKYISLKHGSYKMTIRSRYYDNWCDYAKNVAWYGRKDNRNIYLADGAERNEKG